MGAGEFVHDGPTQRAAVAAAGEAVPISNVLLRAVRLSGAIKAGKPKPPLKGPSGKPILRRPASKVDHRAIGRGGRHVRNEIKQGKLLPSGGLFQLRGAVVAAALGKTGGEGKESLMPPDFVESMPRVADGSRSSRFDPMLRQTDFGRISSPMERP
jgi:hypothetical protein